MEKKIVGGSIGYQSNNELIESVFRLNRKDIIYKRYSIKNEDLSSFLKERYFDFLFVGSPFKKKVVNHVDVLSKSVKNTLSCNFVINKGGVLFAYNTEPISFINLCSKNDINIEDKSVLILGNGPSAKSIKYALLKSGAKSVVLSGRNHFDEGEISFKEANKTDPQILINTTPSGKSVSDKKLVHISNFHKLETVIDIMDSPFRSLYLIDAKNKEKGVLNGVDFAAGNIKIAFSLFYKTILPNQLFEFHKYHQLIRRLNIVFVGVDGKYKNKLFGPSNKDKFYNLIDFKKIIQEVSKKSYYSYLSQNKLDEYYLNEEALVKAFKTLKGKIINTSSLTLANQTTATYLALNGYFVYLKYTKFEDVLSQNKKKVVFSAEEQKYIYQKLNKTYEQYADLTIAKEFDMDELFSEIYFAITGGKIWIY